ncbi:hypothetical protein ABT330_05255 [Streptomyces sp. NPDC000658]
MPGPFPGCGQLGGARTARMERGRAGEFDEFAAARWSALVHKDHP